MINQKETLESLFETENKKVKALESELDQLKETVKKEKSLSNSNFKMQKSEINELSKTVKNLEEKLEVKVEAIKIKDDACREFKRGKLTVKRG